MGVNKKSAKAAKNMRGAPTIKKRNNLQLKGRIFMQNVTDVISLARNGMFWHA